MAVSLRQVGGGTSVLRSASVGARSSFAPSYGGIVSLNAVSDKSRKALPMDKLSKESYAVALQEQIAARKARPMDENSPIKDIFANREISEIERGMGQRNGGPMAPTSKETYAFQLQEQIKQGKELQRLKNERARSLPPPPAALAGVGAIADNASIANLGKRCIGPRSSDTKEDYASFLQQQIAARGDRKQADTRAEQQHEENNGLRGLREEADQAKGRRRVGPLDSDAKNAYHFELQEQVLAREAQRASDQASRRQPGNRDAKALYPPTQAGDLAAWSRGRRHETHIAQPSKDGYQQFLQDQMRERSEQRAAAAHHVQPTEEVPVSAEVAKADFISGGKRLNGPPVIPSHKDYAADLQQQIAARERQCAADGPSGYPRDASSERGGVLPGGQAAPVHGRRHHTNIAPASQETLSDALKQQMKAVQADRAANAFHAQRQGGVEVPHPRDASSERGSVLPGGQAAPVHGRRHPSQEIQAPRASLGDFLTGQRDPSPAPVRREPSTSSPDQAQRYAPLQQGKFGEDTLQPANASSFARNGANMLGAAMGSSAGPASANDTRRSVSFSDSNDDADAHERAMIQRIIEARAAEAQRLLEN